MANVTGEYDVAVEATTAAVNRVLAAIHENQDTSFPVLPHSFRTFVDDTPRGPGDPVPAAERTGVQGIAEVQLASPTISFPQGGGVVLGDTIALARIRPIREPWGLGEPSDISIRTGVRVWMQGSPQPSVPEFVHGDVIVNADIVRTTIGLGTGTVLARRLPGAGGLGDVLGGTFVGLDRDSMSVTFLPAAGTTVSDEERSRIQRIVRNVLRGDFDPVTFQISVPDDVRSWDHRLNPQNASVTLMMLLSQRNLSSGAASGVGRGLVPPGADFAIAIGRDYLLSLFGPELFEGLPGSYSFSRGWGSVTAKVRPNWAGATVELESGRILATIPGSGSIRYVGGLGGVTTDDFTFKVRIPFTLQASGTSLRVVAAGDPDVDLSGVAVFEGWIEDEAESKVRQERDRALNQVQSQVGDQLRIGRRLEDVLKGLHPSPPGVSLTSVQVRPDGVVVGGRIGLAPSKPVVVRQVRRQGKIDALDSWIPGGTIDRFVWYADRPVVQPLRVMAAGGPGQHIEEHRFVREEDGGPLQPVEAFQLRCLDVQGRRLTSGGVMASISGHACGFYIPVLPWPGEAFPVKDGKAMPVVSLEGVRPDGSEGTVGHFNPWASGLAPAKGTSMVVHFADEGGADTDTLTKAFAGARKAPMTAVVILPPGGGGRAAGEIPETGAGLVVGEDVGGHWAEALGVSKRPATVVVDAGGKVALREEGRASASKLTRAMGEGARDATDRVMWQPLRLGVVAGDPVPEFPFRIGGGAELTLRRMRGRKVALTFWASWCEPSIEQLRQLAAAQRAADGQGPLILAVGDGESEEGAQELAKREDLPFPVIPDPDRTISSRFAVGVWPSTVWIGPDLRVESVTLGLTAVGGGGEDRHKGAAQSY